MHLDQPVRVMHILTRPELGGAQANTLHTVRHLDRRQFAPHLVTSPDGPLASEMASIPQAQVTFLPSLVGEINPLQDYKAARDLVRLLRRTRPQIVHTHSSKAGILGRWAAWRAAVPVIIHTVHGFPFHDHQSRTRRAIYVALERAAARWTHRFVCVSQADRQKGVAYGIFRTQDAVIIRSGVSLDSYRQAGGSGGRLRAELGIPASVPLVGMVACLKPQKDPLSFVQVAAQVQRQVPEAWFLVVGDGILRDEVEACRARLGLGERLVLAGWRRDVPAVMDALDLLVLTSLHEGLPRVVPEAMACGRPVVATAVDGTPEVIEDGVTGHLVSPGDVEGAAAKISDLLRNPTRARDMGEEGSRRVAEFDIDDMVRQQEELYTQLIQERDT